MQLNKKVLHEKNMGFVTTQQTANKPMIRSSKHLNFIDLKTS